MNVQNLLLTHTPHIRTVFISNSSTMWSWVDHGIGWGCYLYPGETMPGEKRYSDIFIEEP